MTDEELAEEYAEKMINHKMANHDIFVKEEIKKEIMEAFLAGLKAGRLKWHDLRENQNDLPADNRTVLDEAGDRFCYFRGHFYYENDSRVDCQPIAWCEIPTYTEE